MNTSSTIPLIKLEGVRKKFCTNLKRGMWYASMDLLKQALGIKIASHKLRVEEFWAVDDINLEVHRGERLGIIGLNGAGKTTLMRIIAGIYNSDAGSSTVNAKVVPMFAAGSGMNPLFTGTENIYLKGAVFGMTRAQLDERMNAIVSFADLEEHIHAPFGTYSSGMRARLGFSIALHSDFDVLIVDEGLAVGDQKFRAKAFKALDALPDDKATISIAHNPNLLARVCDRIAVMQHGKLIFESREVSEAIDYYFDHYVAQKSGVDSGASHGKIITSVATDSPISRGIPTVNHNGELCVKLEVNTDELPDDGQVAMQFYDRSRMQVAAVASKQANWFVKRGSGMVNITVKFNHFQLRPGIYWVSVALNRGAHFEVFEKLNFALKFQVLGDHRSEAPIQLMPNWSMEL